MSEWFHVLIAQQVERGELRIERLPDGTLTHRQTPKGERAAEDALRRTNQWDEAMERLEGKVLSDRA